MKLIARLFALFFSCKLMTLPPLVSRSEPKPRRLSKMVCPFPTADANVLLMANLYLRPSSRSRSGSKRAGGLRRSTKHRASGCETAFATAASYIQVRHLRRPLPHGSVSSSSVRASLLRGLLEHPLPECYGKSKIPQRPHFATTTEILTSLSSE